MANGPKTLDLDHIKRYQDAFAKAREWDQFHTPKNLAMALAGEAGELVELFQWLTEKQSFAVTKDASTKVQVEDELADILYYLLRLANVLELDIEQAFWSKTQKNERNYPVELARGKATKYTEL